LGERTGETVQSAGLNIGCTDLRGVFPSPKFRRFIQISTLSACKGMASKAAAPAGAESVKVIVRCRPLSEKEIAQGHTRYIICFLLCDIITPRYRTVEMDTTMGTIRITNPGGKEEPKVFTFDTVYDWKYVY